jgi:hypothetical protein
VGGIAPKVVGLAGIDAVLFDQQLGDLELVPPDGELEGGDPALGGPGVGIGPVPLDQQREGL